MCMYLKRKEPGLMTQIRFGSRLAGIPQGSKARCSLLWVHEWVCSTGWRHSQDIFQLLPPSHARRDATGAKQTRGNLFSPRLTSDNRPLALAHFSFSDRRDLNVFSMLCHHYQLLIFVCVCVFFLSVRANNSSLLFEFAFVLLLKEVSQPIDSHLICCRSL